MIRGQVCQTCRKCGKEIAVITWGVYRRAIVDADPVEVIADPEGQTFIRIDGSKMIGVAADFYEDDRVDAEYVFRPHERSCGVER